MPKINWKQSLYYFIWILVIGLLVYSRLINLGWGLPYPMHPDERNMAIAVQSLNIADMFNPHFFAYGQFPLYLAYLETVIFKVPPTVSLRILSAFASIISAFILTKILALLKVFDKKYFLLIIFSPVLIQFAHFGTTESLLILFYSLVVYFSLLLLQNKIHYSKFLILTSLFSGFAIATKISSVLFLALPIFVLMKKKKIVKLILLTGFFSVLFSPHNLVSFNEFVNSMKYESAVALGQTMVFYTRQFAHSVPVIFQFTKIFPYALGLPIFILSILGMLFLSWKKNEYNLLRLAFIIVFLPNAFMYAKWTRFIAPAFPFMIIFAILFLFNLKLPRFLFFVLCFIILIPGVAYLSVYRNLDVRIRATQWINTNIPGNARILSETANVVDVPLDNTQYNLISFNFYDLDRDKNLQEDLENLIPRADYIIIPSRRIFKNHPKEQYPLLDEYYRKLFDGEFGFKEIAEFHSYPKLFVEFPDENAEETWTVFDHPVVRIFKRI